MRCASQELPDAFSAKQQSKGERDGEGKDGDRRRREGGSWEAGEAAGENGQEQQELSE